MRRPNSDRLPLVLSTATYRQSFHRTADGGGDTSAGAVWGMCARWTETAFHRKNTKIVCDVLFDLSYALRVV
jgi:hypothetical protein